jgi:hypothetical protein
LLGVLEILSGETLVLLDLTAEVPDFFVGELPLPDLDAATKVGLFGERSAGKGRLDEPTSFLGGAIVDRLWLPAIFCYVQFVACKVVIKGVCLVANGSVVNSQIMAGLGTLLKDRI